MSGHQKKTLLVYSDYTMISTQVARLIIWSLVIHLPYTACYASLDVSETAKGLPFRDSNEYEHRTFKSPRNITDDCLAFFTDYVEAAGNFTKCELLNAQPFRLCSNCIKPYVIASALFNDLKNKPELKKCRTKLMLSDRVQIIPTFQKNIEAVWTEADCEGCSSDVSINHTTREVIVTVPKEVSKFVELFGNLSFCLGIINNFEAGSLDDIHKQIENTSKVCHRCRDMYIKFNSHYESIWDSTDGNVCMDLVDMMNFTRLLWSTHLNCTHRSADSSAVIIITCAVATSPFFFYISLRLTGKEREKKIFKQKRLGANHDMSSVSQSLAGGDGSTLTQRSLTPFT